MAWHQKTTYNNTDWYRLDNAAKIYPAVSSSGRGNVFRVAVLLKKEIDPERLQEALEKILPRFPSFAVKMKRGLFWYYFESNSAIPEVTVEKTPPCKAINPDDNKGFLFRVNYFKRRISLEVFHSLADGAGALVFLKSLAAKYLILMGNDISYDDSVLDYETYPSASETEDSFKKYYDPKVKGHWKEERAYQVYGSRMPLKHVRLIHGIMPVADISALAKDSKATITEYLAALLVYSVYCSQIKGRNRHAPVKVSIPVNLRNFFPSRTLRNFSSYVNIGFNFAEKEGMHYNDYSFRQVLDALSEEMKNEIKHEKLTEKISANVKAEKNVFLRMTPLILKNMVLRTAYNAFGEQLTTTTLSNLGIINVPGSMTEHIERFEIVLGTPILNAFNSTVCSFNGNMVITFFRMIYETDIERCFFRFLSEQGVKIVIETN